MSFQVKFSELTLDMFRFLQLVEHEPVEELMLAAKKNIQQQQVAIIPANVGSSTSGGGGGTEKQKMDEKQTSSKRVNPHKYLLFRPSFSQLMVYLSTAFKVRRLASCLVERHVRRRFPCRIWKRTHVYCCTCRQNPMLDLQTRVFGLPKMQWRDTFTEGW